MAPNDIDPILRAAGVRGCDVLIGEEPHSTRGGTIGGANAIAAWHALREMLPAAGFWPVLLGDAESLDRLREGWSGSPLAELERAESLQVETWLRDRAESDSPYLAAVPTPRSWEVPAYLLFGGWNECPQPSEHVAMLRYWSDGYGAEVVGVSSDIVECAVRAPPGTRDAALALADEQFVYCPDIVSQGTETIEHLAATLVRAHIWYFWWD